MHEQFPALRVRHSNGFKNPSNMTFLGHFKFTVTESTLKPIKVDSEVIRRVLFLEYLLRTSIVTKNQ